jgi:phosphatidate phosphatase APP1
LREWGLSWEKLIAAQSRRTQAGADPQHAAALQRSLVHLDRDSGQHDLEIYRQIVEEHPGRVLAVYIHSVSKSAERLRQIEALATVVAQASSSLLLAADSETARRLETQHID